MIDEYLRNFCMNKKKQEDQIKVLSVCFIYISNQTCVFFFLIINRFIKHNVFE